MVQSFPGNPLGSSIETGEVTDNSITLAKIADQAGDGALVFDAAGAPTFLASGTAGQALAVNSGATALEFADVGNMTLIETLTASAAASITFNTSIPTTGYVVIAGQIRSDSGDVLLTFNSDTGNNYRHTHLNGTALATTTGDTDIPLGGTSNCDLGLFLVIPIEAEGSNHYISGGVHADNTTYALGGGWASANDITSVTLSAGGGAGQLNSVGGVSIYILTV